MSKPRAAALYIQVRYLALLVVLFGCGGDDGPPPPDGGDVDPPLRVPQIDELRPPEAPLFGEAFAMQVVGSGFDADAVVILDGQPLVTRVVSPTELSADVPATALEALGIRLVVASHTEPDGGVSDQLGLRVIDGIAAPLVDVVVPDRAFAGAPGFQVTVRGWNFYPTSVVQWNGAPRATTYVNASELRIAVTAADVAAVGTVPVSVVTEGVPPSVNATFTIEAAPVSSLDRLNVTPADAQSTGFANDPSVSADGRYVAFAAEGNDLVAGDTARRDIFWRDTCRGAPADCTPTTRRISERFDGGNANADSQDPMISASGRYVAFASNAGDLVSDNPPTTPQVHVHDTCLGATGCTPSTVKAASPTITFTSTIFPSVSGDGRFVVYVAGISVWIADTCFGATGCTPSVARADARNDGTPGDRAAESPYVSANGRYALFISNSRNFDAPQAGFTTHAYILDTCFGATGCTRSLQRLDVPPDGVTEADSLVANGSLSVSADGRFATFSSPATNLLATAITTTSFQVYLRDTCFGAAAGCTPSTILVSTNSAGDPGNGNSMSSSVTANGRFVVFQSKASNLVGGDTNNRRDVFVRDTCINAPAGCTPTTRLVSVGPNSVLGQDDSPVSETYSPRISDDGLVTVWASRANNLVPNDTNLSIDAFISIGVP